MQMNDEKSTVWRCQCFYVAMWDHTFIISFKSIQLDLLMNTLSSTLLASFHSNDKYYCPRYCSSFSYFHHHFTNGTGGADKSLARPGRKQANVSVRMTWISFGALPYREKTCKLAYRCCWIRASLKCFWACILPGRAKDLSAPRSTFRIFVLHFIRNLTCLTLQCQAQVTLWTLIPYLLLATTHVMVMNALKGTVNLKPLCPGH